MFTVTCTIDYAYKSDSGEYWCEGGRGERSNTVNITVTDGSVILESPVLPVVERDAVTLSCRKKTTSSNLTADFYKDGHHVGSSSTGTLTIHSVSMSDEGLYRCNISGAGESPESWLAVRDGSVILKIPVLPVMEGDAVTLQCRNKQSSSNLPADFYREGLLIGNSLIGEMTIHRVSKSDEGLYKCRMSGAGESPESWLAVRDLHRVTCFSWDHSFCLLLLVRTVFTIVIVAVLLPVVVLLHCGKLRASMNLVLKSGTNQNTTKLDTKSRVT
ncbi:cell adhesion molecule CEACAM20-like [Acanthopagrus schlegelii]